jgi:hypothetical protein
MSAHRTLGWRAGAIVALLSHAAIGSAQTRFEPLAVDTIGAIRGLQVVTVRDNTQRVCYALFVMQPPAAPAAAADGGATPSLADAIARRNHQLDELSTAYERSLTTNVPGLPMPNPLRQQWELQKVQSEFDRTVRERELRILRDWLEEIAGGPRLAVSGPVPCGGEQKPPAPREQ